uniref:Uncharacterized protein n=1 Tax=Ditylenchus dipsaci TaxID=166011 RepID=A0A915E2Y4_9BILA
MPVCSFACKTLGWANEGDGMLVFATINTHERVISVTKKLLPPTFAVRINISVIGSCVKVSDSRTKVCLGYLYCERKVETPTTKNLSAREGIEFHSTTSCTPEEVARSFKALFEADNEVVEAALNIGTCFLAHRVPQMMVAVTEGNCTQHLYAGSEFVSKSIVQVYGN